ncbi:MAG: hypothetical protein ABH822_00840 [Patescibacteria group bacterium]
MVVVILLLTPAVLLVEAEVRLVMDSVTRQMEKPYLIAQKIAAVAAAGVVFMRIFATNLVGV